MDEAAPKSVLERIASTGRTPPTKTRISIERTMQTVAAKVADRSCGLILKVVEIEEKKRARDPMVEHLSEDDLIILLRNEAGILGAALFDIQVVSGMIEAQTYGVVSEGAAPYRKPTRTDAAVVEGFLNALLFEMDQVLEGFARAKNICGFEARMAMTGPRALGLALEDEPYQLFELGLDLGQGAKTGKLTLIFPLAISEETAPEIVAEEESWGAGLAQAVGAAQTELDVVLYRLMLPLAEMGTLQVGQEIALPMTAVGEMELIDSKGTTVAIGGLGQLNGMKAIRISIRSSGAAPLHVTAASTVADAQADDDGSSPPSMSELLDSLPTVPKSA